MEEKEEAKQKREAESPTDGDQSRRDEMPTCASISSGMWTRCSTHPRREWCRQPLPPCPWSLSSPLQPAMLLKAAIQQHTQALTSSVPGRRKVLAALQRLLFLRRGRAHAL